MFNFLSLHTDWMSWNTKFALYLEQIHGHVCTKMQQAHGVKKAYIMRNKNISKHTFQWIFFCDGIRCISLEYKYNLLSGIPSWMWWGMWSEKVNSCVQYSHLTFVPKKSGKIVRLMHK